MTTDSPTGAPHAFDLDEARAVLARTPTLLDALLRGLPAAWTTATEGPGTWSPRDIVGHLCHGERADWIPRVRHLLEHGTAVAFTPFDREAQFIESAGKPLDTLLHEFTRLRAASLDALAALELSEADLDRPGLHPSLGTVTLRQLLATWVAHDLDHVMQIARVMGRRYADDVGPWRAYLRVINGTGS